MEALETLIDSTFDSEDSFWGDKIVEVVIVCTFTTVLGKALFSFAQSIKHIEDCFWIVRVHIYLLLHLHIFGCFKLGSGFRWFDVCL